MVYCSHPRHDRIPQSLQLIPPLVGFPPTLSPPSSNRRARSSPSPPHQTIWTPSMFTILDLFLRILFSLCRHSRRSEFYLYPQHRIGGPSQQPMIFWLKSPKPWGWLWANDRWCVEFDEDQRDRMLIWFIVIDRWWVHRPCGGWRWRRRGIEVCGLSWCVAFWIIYNDKKYIGIRKI